MMGCWYIYIPDEPKVDFLEKEEKFYSERISKVSIIELKEAAVFAERAKCVVELYSKLIGQEFIRREGLK